MENCTPKGEAKNLMLEQMENESGNVVLSHARPATSCHSHAAPFSDPFFIFFRTARVCVYVTIYIVTLSSLCQLGSVIFCFAQLFKDVPKDVGGSRGGVWSGGVSKQTAAAQLHYPASADGWLLRSSSCASPASCILAPFELLIAFAGYCNLASATLFPG